MENMKCPECGAIRNPKFKFCPADGAKLLPESEVAGMVMPLENGYDQPYGLWNVTTEGDEEGRTIRNLGTYQGYIDEIARELAHKAFYKLTFEREQPLSKAKMRQRSVTVTLGIKSGTWDMSGKDRAVTIAEMLKERPVLVKEGNQYASVVFQFQGEE